MLVPKKQKFRKAHKGRVPEKSKSRTTLSFGSFGLKSIDKERITARQIESARRAAVRNMKRKGKFFIRLFPDLPVSKKPNEVRMGKGKGGVEYYASRVSPGCIMFEVEGVDESSSIQSLQLAAAKLPVRTKIVRSYDE
ncbi:MAG TPA: 50S ribosomal protein L16 [Candidatus Megaira endosymbiont of Hartmannula sinica]|nr:50S ribosomal protein L16 [Candidatus Megaera endosymbiont of Hartmannula sinica]